MKENGHLQGATGKAGKRAGPEVSQLVLEGFGGCGCWSVRDQQGLVLRARSCAECLGRALDFLLDLSELDKVVSVSALSRRGEALHGQDS